MSSSAAPTFSFDMSRSFALGSGKGGAGKPASAAPTTMVPFFSLPTADMPSGKTWGGPSAAPSTDVASLTESFAKLRKPGEAVSGFAFATNKAPEEPEGGSTTYAMSTRPRGRKPERDRVYLTQFNADALDGEDLGGRIRRATPRPRKNGKRTATPRPKSRGRSAGARKKSGTKRR